MMDDQSVAIKGGFWTSVSTVITMLAQLLRLIILTRFLEKSDFGIASITNSVIFLCLTFTDLGFASVIMYKKDISKDEFSSLYWMQALFFLFLYIILVLTAPFIASYYEEELLSTLIMVSGLSVIGQALGKLYDSVLLKAYYFKSLAIRNILTSLVSLLVAWFLAYNDYGVFSLVYSSLLQIFAINFWNFITGYRIQPISLKLSIKLVLPLVKIGIYETGTHILDFFSNKIDVFIIGKFLGMEILGTYDLAKELVIKFVYLIRTVVSKVALPIIANNNNDDEAVVLKFLSMTKVVSYLCIPICISLAVFSEAAVRIVYGDNYLEITSMVSIFAIMAMISSISGFFDMLGIAKGRTDLNFYNTVFRVIFTVPLIIIASMISIMAVAWSQLAFSIVGVCVFWYIVVTHTYHISVKTYLSQFARVLMVFSICGLFVAIIMESGVIAFIDNWIGNLLIYICAYIVILLLTAQRYLRDETKYVLQFINRKKIF